MKILLVNPPYIEIYGQYKSAAKVGAQPQMPLGLLYIASVMRTQGYEVTVIDSDVEGLSVNDVLNYIETFNPDLLGVTATTPVYNSAKMIIEGAIKIRPHMVTVLGGFHISALPKETMEECPAVDFGVIGEGEETIKELLNALEKRVHDFQAIKGLLYRKDSEVFQNSVRPPNLNLDQIPFPALDLIKMDRYRWSVPGRGIVKVASIISQRGCPYQCIFCGVHTMFPGKTRYRSIVNIVDELELINKKYGVSHIFFHDDTLTLNKNKIFSMIKEIKKRGLNFTFEGYTRANTVTFDMLKALKEVGLVRLSFGIESGNDKILKAIKKGIEKDELRKVYQ